MIFRIVEQGKGARLEKRDKEAYNGYREVAKIHVDDREDQREILNELREVLDRNKMIAEIAEGDEELLKRLE